MNKKYMLLTDYKEPLISFSNSYYEGNKYGVQNYDEIKLNNFNYVLFCCIIFITFYKTCYKTCYL